MTSAFHHAGNMPLVDDAFHLGSWSGLKLSAITSLHLDGSGACTSSLSSAGTPAFNPNNDSDRASSRGRVWREAATFSTTRLTSVDLTLSKAPAALSIAQLDFAGGSMFTQGCQVAAGKQSHPRDLHARSTRKEVPKGDRRQLHSSTSNVDSHKAPRAGLQISPIYFMVQAVVAMPFKQVRSPACSFVPSDAHCGKWMRNIVMMGLASPLQVA